MAKKEKILELINDHKIMYENKTATPEEIKAAHKRQELREQKLADSPIFRNNINRKKVVKKPIRPRPNIHLNNPLSNTATDNFLELVDPGGWADEKKVQVEENLFDKYLELLKKGELLPGTTFEMFEKNFMGYDTETISKIKKEINKRIAAKKRTEGLAALMGVKA